MQPFFYLTQAGAEVDLVLEFDPGNHPPAAWHPADAQTKRPVGLVEASVVAPDG